jgi:hypothetical protein
VPTVTMRIPVSRAGAIAQVFQEEGLEVSWEAPMEKATGAEREAVQVRSTWLRTPEGERSALVSLWPCERA